MLVLADLLEALSGIRPSQNGPAITATVIDSRQTIPGALFVALPGENVDGHDYIEDAFKRRACLALVQKDLSARYPTLDLRSTPSIKTIETLPLPCCLLVDDSLKAMQKAAAFWRRKLDVRVIGITGSVGKSTTKELIAELLDQRYDTLKNPGNFNNEIGLPLTLLGLRRSHQRAVLEMGFYVPGEIAFLCELAQPAVGIVTNIGTVHAERAGSQEAIFRGKSELVQALPPEGIAILNYDDPWVRQMAELTQARVLFYGLSPQADIWADNVEGLGLEGIRFRLHFRKETIHLRVPLLGRHSVHTVLRATAAGITEGLTWQEIVDGLHSEHAQLRLVIVRAKSDAIILDDTYNASPESTLAALNLLEDVDGQKVAVLGDMLELGPYEVAGHEIVGRRAAAVANRLVTVGPRAHIIAQAAVQSGMNKLQVTELETSDEAIEYLKDRLSANDVVLVKGSHGMRMDRIVAALEAREE